MIWGGGVGFPKPLDGPIFKSWARTRMAVWHAWYQAFLPRSRSPTSTTTIRFEKGCSAFLKPTTRHGCG